MKIPNHKPDEASIVLLGTPGKHLTWGQLKAFVHTIPAEDLEKPVYVWGEELDATKATSIAISTDDLIAPAGICEPVSKYGPGCSEPVIIPKGHLILEV